MPSPLGKATRYCCYGAALLLIVLGEDGAQSAPVALLVFLLVASGVALLAVTIKDSAKSRYYLASSPALVMGAFFIHYCFGAIVVIVWNSLPWTITVNRSAFDIHSVQANIGSGTYLALIAGLGLYAGSSINVRFPLSRRHTDEADIRQLRPVAAVLLAICGLVLLFVPRISAEWQQLVQVLGSFSSLMIAVAAYVAAGSRTHADRQRWWMVCAAGCALFAMQGLTNGAREDFIKPVMFATMGYIAARRRIPWIPMFVAVLVLIFAGLPILNTAKHEIIEHGGSGGIGGLQEARDQVASTDYSLTIENVVSNLAQRLSLISFPAVYCQFYPHVFPWLGGETFVLEAEELVPRALWPDKPEIGRLLDGYSQQVGIIGKGDTKTSAKFDFVSEYYINFGTWGLFAFSWLQGLFFRLLGLSVPDRVVTPHRHVDRRSDHCPE